MTNSRKGLAPGEFLPNLTPAMQDVLDRLPPGREMTSHALGRPSKGTLNALIARKLILQIRVPPSPRNRRGVTIYKRAYNGTTRND